MTRARDLAAFVSNADGDIKFDTDTLFIDSSANRVGIGTTTPSEQINLVGSSGASKIRFDGDSSNLQNNFIGITGYDDLVIASDEANSGSASTIQLKVDGSERMRINSSGEVNIGTTSSLLSATNRANITLNGTSEGIINLGIGGSQGGYLYQTATDLAVWNTKNGPLRFAANNAEVGRFLSGGGLTFNGDTAAANALDDYEEGTFTPTMLNAGGSIAYASSSTKGYYTKVGDIVSITLVITFGSITSSTSHVQIGSLPFTVKNVTSHFPVPSLFIENGVNATGASNGGFSGLGVINSTTISLYTQQASTGNNYVEVKYNMLNTSSSSTVNRVRLSMTYRAE